MTEGASSNTDWQSSVQASAHAAWYAAYGYAQYGTPNATSGDAQQQNWVQYPVQYPSYDYATGTWVGFPQGVYSPHPPAPVEPPKLNPPLPPGPPPPPPPEEKEEKENDKDKKDRKEKDKKEKKEKKSKSESKSGEKSSASKSKKESRKSSSEQGDSSKSPKDGIPTVPTYAQMCAQEAQQASKKNSDEPSAPSAHVPSPLLPFPQAPCYMTPNQMFYPHPSMPHPPITYPLPPQAFQQPPPPPPPPPPPSTSCEPSQTAVGISKDDASKKPTYDSKKESDAKHPSYSGTEQSADSKQQKSESAQSSVSSRQQPYSVGGQQCGTPIAPNAFGKDEQPYSVRSLKAYAASPGYIGYPVYPGYGNWPQHASPPDFSIPPPNFSIPPPIPSSSEKNSDSSSSQQSGSQGVGPVKFNLTNKRGNLNSYNNPLQNAYYTPPKDVMNMGRDKHAYRPTSFSDRYVSSAAHEYHEQCTGGDRYSRNSYGPPGYGKDAERDRDSRGTPYGERKRVYDSQDRMLGDEDALGPYSNKRGNFTSPRQSDFQRNEMAEHSKEKGVSSDEGAAALAKGDWPESLKRYVRLCFSKCVTNLDKDQVEICLKGKLTQAAANKTLWTKDWDKEPLPNIFSENLLNQIKNEFPTQDSRKPGSTVPAPSKGRFTEGDPSRGFTITRRSRSRSGSPGEKFSPRKGRRQDVRRRHSSSESNTSSNNSFLSFGANRRGRGGNRGGRGNRGNRFGNFQNKEQKDDVQVSEEENKNASYFYSKHGRMTLDADLGTKERLQNRAARFATMEKGTDHGRGRGRGRGGVLGKEDSDTGPPLKGAGGRGRGRWGAQRGRGARNRGGHNRKIMPNIADTINAQIQLDNNMDWSSMHIVGTSTELEKQYLRLTSAPDPSTIRTLATLKLSLEHVKTQWVANRDYHYACDQLKSIRQDLTVQGIRDEFTVLVYETHCRIALETGDHEEYNQCQSQLRQLYQDIGGANIMEFKAYRLLYYIFTKNTLDMTSLLASLTKLEKEDPCMIFALKFRAAWALSNIHCLFTLYKCAPKMSGYLIDWFIERERKQAVKKFVKAYRPGNVDAEFVKTTLSISSDDEWSNFVETVGLVFTDASKSMIDCKSSAGVLAV